MESSGLLNVEDPIQIFVLHTIFIPRISHCLNEFSEAFNSHAVSTEGNWTPSQIWINCLSPSEENNNVVVESIPLDNKDILESYVLDVVDPLTMSTQLGIDLYTQALYLVMERMDL
ncbi:uncharacterized protein LOC113666893 [Pocillopora damicornis]|uniref:uncharacterized protein LOC113666893 n=1 Tax=Pocillopora damicornis TaxID=46731 RepID=UPI000F55378C|nr:uncharacterized protein LOC113666893 [Pocillopora damicornis]